MTKVRIVGGGLMGVLAAFEAHRLGCRDIELHERLGDLGGADLPAMSHGLELRDEQLEFGPPDGPLRRLLEWRGVLFDDVASDATTARYPGWRQAEITEPAAERRHPSAPGSRSLADWIRAHPPEVAGPLGRYCQWRLRAWLDAVDESAAGPLGVDRRAADPLASPRGGLSHMFAVCGQALDQLGAVVHTRSHVFPRQALDAVSRGEVVVWTPGPTAFFAQAGSPPPRSLNIASPTYFLLAEHDGALPLHVRDFTPGGALAALHLYESRGQGVLAAECLAQVSEADLRREIAQLAAAAAVGEALKVGQFLGASHRPHRRFRSVAEVRETDLLRDHLARAHGAALITDAWSPQPPAELFAGLRKGLRAALDGRTSLLRAVA